MERTVPRTASGEVELYIRTYYSLLRTTDEVKIQTLEEVHAGMKSLLHHGARSLSPDLSAFVYSILRLPDCMPETRLVVLGQSEEVFDRAGYHYGENWQSVSARARRRRSFFDGVDTLFCFIASRSDIDDVIPLLTAYQIEWNKMHLLLQKSSQQWTRSDPGGNDRLIQSLSDALGISENEVQRLNEIWGDQFSANIAKIAAQPCNLGVRLISGSLSEYRRATHSWWENIHVEFPDLHNRPVYFISSNPHSVLNLLSGFALLKEKELIEYLEGAEDEELAYEWADIQNFTVPSNRENFFYYVLKKYQNTSRGKHLISEQLDFERNHGLLRVWNERCFDLEAQIVDLKSLDWDVVDPRLKASSLRSNLQKLSKSDALILNIDYPLGLAAYNVLSEVAEHVGSVLGVYIIGKAATLNGVVGDVMIPNVVHDEHSQNTYLFNNPFSAAEVSPYLVYGTVLDNQKSVSVLGTFLQNERYMDVFYREGYTAIEMEAGPNLSAVYEMVRPKRHPVNEFINLYGLPFDFGLIHYASDTPLGKGRNLGAGSLSYYGMDSSYAAAIAILLRIISWELERLS